MATHREDVRAERNATIVEAKKVGVDLREERRKYGTNQRGLVVAAQKLINEGAPRQDEDVLTFDNPPAGALDGANTTFTLTGQVAGQAVGVVWGDIAGARTIPLARSDDNPPSADSFFFSFDTPATIIVGTAPQAVDALIVVYRSRK